MVHIQVQFVRTDPDERDAVPTEVEIKEIAEKWGPALHPEDPDCGIYLAEMDENDVFVKTLEAAGYVEDIIAGTGWSVTAEMP